MMMLFLMLMLIDDFIVNNKQFNLAPLFSFSIFLLFVGACLNASRSLLRGYCVLGVRRNYSKGGQKIIAQKKIQNFFQSIFSDRPILEM